MKEQRRAVYLTKERLTKPEEAHNGELPRDVVDTCSDKMRVALQNPAQVPNMITFIELEL
jgi:hypothetical protein